VCYNVKLLQKDKTRLVNEAMSWRGQGRGRGHTEWGRDRGWGQSSRGRGQGQGQGRRHNFKSGGTYITASEASRKFLGVVQNKQISY